MSTIRTFQEAAAWVRGAVEALMDPSEPVCVLLFRWERDIRAYIQHPANANPDLVVGVVDEDLVLALPWDLLVFPLRNGEPEIRDGVELATYGATPISPGVWVVEPSLNVEGAIHGFVILYDVPSPAPWELAEPKPFPLLPQLWVPR